MDKGIGIKLLLPLLLLMVILPSVHAAYTAGFIDTNQLGGPVVSGIAYSNNAYQIEYITANIPGSATKPTIFAYGLSPTSTVPMIFKDSIHDNETLTYTVPYSWYVEFTWTASALGAPSFNAIGINEITFGSTSNDLVVKSITTNAITGVGYGLTNNVISFNTIYANTIIGIGSGGSNNAIYVNSLDAYTLPFVASSPLGLSGNTFSCSTCLTTSSSYVSSITATNGLSASASTGAITLEARAGTGITNSITINSISSGGSSCNPCNVIINGYSSNNFVFGTANGIWNSIINNNLDFGVIAGTGISNSITVNNLNVSLTKFSISGNGLRYQNYALSLLLGNTLPITLTNGNIIGCTGCGVNAFIFSKPINYNSLNSTVYLAYNSPLLTTYNTLTVNSQQFGVAELNVNGNTLVGAINIIGSGGIQISSNSDPYIIFSCSTCSGGGTSPLLLAPLQPPAASQPPSTLIISIIAFVVMWLLVILAFIFFKEGDDKHTLLLLSASVLALLAVFSMLIPTYNIIKTPSYNVISAGNTIIQYSAFNTTTINNQLTTPVIALYAVFGVFLAFIFFILAVWSFKNRLEYYSTQEYKKNLGHKVQQRQQR